MSVSPRYQNLLAHKYMQYEGNLYRMLQDLPNETFSSLKRKIHNISLKHRNEFFVGDQFLSRDKDDTAFRPHEMTPNHSDVTLVQQD